MKTGKDQSLEQTIASALTDETTSDEVLVLLEKPEAAVGQYDRAAATARADVLQRDHQTKMAALYDAYEAEVSQNWRRR